MFVPNISIPFSLFMVFFLHTLMQTFCILFEILISSVDYDMCQILKAAFKLILQFFNRYVAFQKIVYMQRNNEIAIQKKNTYHFGSIRILPSLIKISVHIELE